MYSSRIWALPAEYKVPRLRKMIRFAHHFASLGMTIQEEHFTTFRYLSVTSDHAIHKHLSLQMHGGLGLFEASGSLLHFGHPILRPDFVAAVFAEDAAFGGFRRRHGRVHSDLPFRFDYLFYFRDQRFILFWRQPLLFFHQVILEARDGVALLPEVEHRLGHVADGIVSGVVNLAGVGAVDDDAGDAVSDGAFGKVFAAVLHFRRRRVGPEIALDEEHETEILHGGEVDAFVSDASGLAAVADIGHDCQVASLQARAERNPR